MDLGGILLPPGSRLVPRYIFSRCLPRRPPWCAPLGWKICMDLTFYGISRYLPGICAPWNPPSWARKVLIWHHNRVLRRFLGRVLLVFPGYEVGYTEVGSLRDAQGSSSLSSYYSRRINGGITLSSSSDSLYSMSVTIAPWGWWVHSSLYCGVADSGQAWTWSNSLKNYADML